MTKKIKINIIKREEVEWKKLKILQPESFKEIDEHERLKIKQSFVNNNVIESFKVWENEGEIYVLDGKHRINVLYELETDGYNVPEKMPADFVECKDKKDAIRKIFIYSSRYARVTYDGLYDMLVEFEMIDDADEIFSIADIPDIQFDAFDEMFLQEDIMSSFEGGMIDKLKPTNEVMIVCPKCQHEFPRNKKNINYGRDEYDVRKAEEA